MNIARRYIVPIRRPALIVCAVLLFCVLGVILILDVAEVRARNLLTAEFNAMNLPLGLEAITSRFGHDGPSGTLSLTRVYRVDSTRIILTQELVKTLGQRGYSDAPSALEGCCHTGFFAQNVGVGTVHIEMYPQDRVHDPQLPNYHVDSVVITLDLD
jgi:hypothetical protein